MNGSGLHHDIRTVGLGDDARQPSVSDEAAIALRDLGEAPPMIVRRHAAPIPIASWIRTLEMIGQLSRSFSAASMSAASTTV